VCGRCWLRLGKVLAGMCAKTQRALLKWLKCSLPTPTVVQLRWLACRGKWTLNAATRAAAVPRHGPWRDMRLECSSFQWSTAQYVLQLPARPGLAALSAFQCCARSTSAGASAMRTYLSGQARSCWAQISQSTTCHVQHSHALCLACCFLSSGACFLYIRHPLPVLELLGVAGLLLRQGVAVRRQAGCLHTCKLWLFWCG
jgi:hypothetical protein